MFKNFVAMLVRFFARFASAETIPTGANVISADRRPTNSQGPYLQEAKTVFLGFQFENPADLGAALVFAAGETRDWLNANPAEGTLATYAEVFTTHFKEYIERHNISCSTSR